MLDKHYDPHTLEDRWYKAWEDSGLFHSERDPEREPFTIVIPPPNVTGRLHMGHVLNNTLQDIIIRQKRMAGYNACWVPGMDHAGIATQTMVEKQLRERGIDPVSLSREEFLERVWTWKETHGGVIIKQLRKLGASCDWQREAFTMDETRSLAVNEVFKRLYEKGHIYRGFYIVNWCPALQTALSDDEVEREEMPSHLWHFRYPLVDGKDHLVVATTRPETMLGDTGVAVHPDDARYRHLVGQMVRLPLTDREIPIVADTHVDPEFGTGCVKVTPAHDPNDFEMGRTHDLEFILVMDKTAHMNENVPERFRGMYRYRCREAVVTEMEALGLLEKIEDHTVAVGRCYRTHDIIEPYLSQQWFIKMKPFAESALKAVLEGEIRFYPKRWVNTYNHWLTHIRDWCISRQLRWGHRIPIWYCGACAKQTCATTDPDACAHCGSDQLEQDSDVLDTWASSWLWPFSVFGWPEKNPDLDYYYPTQLLITAADIIFFWVARMIIAGQEFMKTNPFAKVLFNGIVRDLEGKKMSKTLGNSPDPLAIIDRYGADALRFSIVYNTPYGQDTRFAEASCELGRGFCTKIWNANRFLRMSFEGVRPDRDWRDRPRDIVARWILSRLAATIRGIDEDFQQLRIAAAASRIYNFFWGELCDWYVEFLKPLLKVASHEEKAALLGRTVHVIDRCLRLLHPFMPFITEELWQHLAPRAEGEFLMNQPWPKSEPAWIDENVDAAMQLPRELITGIRAMRKSQQIPAKARPHLYLHGDVGQERVLGEIEPILLKLAGLERYTFLEQDSAPEGCTALNLKGMSAYLDLRGHLDVATELDKIAQKVQKLERELKSQESRLLNPNFLARAPDHVVAKVKKEYEDLKRQIESLTQTRNDLEQMSRK